ncbi:MAG: hypothetical protein U0031_01855 [Thermomicrobiales bacterium]
MSPSPLWPVKDDEQEWPKLDLLPHHFVRLMLTWTIPYSDDAADEFGDLLDTEDGFVSVMSYSRHRVKHHRIESARPALDESNDLIVGVQYEVGTPFLSQIPKELEEPAYLLESLMAFPPEAPVTVAAQFEFPANQFASVVPLPLEIPPPADSPAAFDRIVGIHGVREGTPDDIGSGHEFTLDREPTGHLRLTIDFKIPAGPADAAPELALATAIERAGLIVSRTGR